MIDLNPLDRVLAQMSVHVELLSNENNFDLIEAHWSSFLDAATRFWNYGNNIKKTAKSKEYTSWWNEQIQRRKNSPILTYIFQAKHAGNHGIKPILNNSENSTTAIGAPGSSLYIENLVVVNGQIISAKIHSDAQTIISVTPPGAQLVAVTNRGKEYQPPFLMGATAVSYLTPFNVAKNAVSIMQDIIQGGQEIFQCRQ